MIKLKFSKLNNRGDTIVEVLISILIVGTVVTGGYAITRNSTIAERQAQEHSEALNLLQAQVEAMRTNANTVEQPQYNSGVAFCMIPSSASVVKENGLTSSKIGNLSKFSNKYKPECELNSAGQTNNTTEPIYYISILSTSEPMSTNSSDSVSPSNPNVTTYYLQATWYSASGNGYDTAQLSYRLQ